MKEPQERQTNQPQFNPAGLTRANLLFRRLHLAAQEARGSSLTYEELFELTGEPKSTLSRWLNGEGQPSSEALLRLLELIPDQLHREIMDRPPFRRMFPRLEHPWLAHDPAAISHMRTILSRPSGLTVIRGDQESWVTFTITAMGHASAILEPGRCIVGLDIHAPDWFVPVPGVMYLENQLNPERVRKELDLFWSKVASSRGSLVIMNGTLPLGSVSNPATRALVSHSQLVLAERVQPKSPPELVPAPANIVTVSSSRTNPERLALRIEHC